jgi:hypothetical protein
VLVVCWLDVVCWLVVSLIAVAGPANAPNGLVRAVCFLKSAICCLLFAVCCLLSAVCYLLSAVTRPTDWYAFVPMLQSKGDGARKYCLCYCSCRSWLR